MKLAMDQTNAAEARAILDQFPDLYSAVLRGTRIEQQNEAGMLCSFELPLVGKRTVTAPTALEAIRAALLELTDILTRTPTQMLPQGLRGAVPKLPVASENLPISKDNKGVRFQGKERQLTIGVSMLLKHLYREWRTNNALPLQKLLDKLPRLALKTSMSEPTQKARQRSSPYCRRKCADGSRLTPNRS